LFARPVAAEELTPLLGSRHSWTDLAEGKLEVSAG
jgi:hypothetical protein